VRLRSGSRLPQQGGTDFVPHSGPMEPPPFELYVSGDAVDRIHGAGGRIFIWNEPVGLGVRDCVSSTPPPNVMFDSYLYEKRDVEVWTCVPEEFEFEKVTVQLRRWPFRGYRVTVGGGERWGFRGDQSTLMHSGLPTSCTE
jgi:hypothetical protein